MNPVITSYWIEKASVKKGYLAVETAIIIIVVTAVDAQGFIE
jgi:hypothetical protein